MSTVLTHFVGHFAEGLAAADARRPIAVGVRSGRVYGAGIGPFAEREAVRLAVIEVERAHPGEYAVKQDARYGTDGKRRCDLVIGGDPSLMIEVKMARQYGDNGKPDPTAVKDLLSPYPVDRSALTDCIKLASFREGADVDAGLLIYGFESDERPLDALIDAFEVLADRVAELGERVVASFGPLVHPVHANGRVFAWPVLSRREKLANPSGS